MQKAVYISDNDSIDTQDRDYIGIIMEMLNPAALMNYYHAKNNIADGINQLSVLGFWGKIPRRTPVALVQPIPAY